MLETIPTRLEEFSGDLLPIRQVAERLLDGTAQFDAESGTIFISQRPKLGPEAFALVLFAGIPEEMITTYLNARSLGLRSNLAIPPTYLRMLSVLNGAELYQLQLYGLPPSLCDPDAFPNRPARQPLDLGAANITWSRVYRPSPLQFHFGTAPWSYEENLAYFLNPDDTVEAHRVGGALCGSWPSFEKFLEEELPRVETLFAAHEARTEKLHDSIGLHPNRRIRRF